MHTKRSNVDFMQNRPSKWSHFPRTGICFEPLEPRLLLSGTWGTGADSPVAEDHATAESSFSQDTVVESTVTESTSTTASDGTVDLLDEAPALSLFGNAVPQLDVGSPSRHVGRDGHLAGQPGAGDDLGLRLNVVGI